MGEIFLTKANTASLEIRYVGKIGLTEYNYSEKYPSGRMTLLLKSSMASENYSTVRMIEIYATLYTGLTKFGATDVFTNNSNIDVYFIKYPTYVEMYVKVPQYYKCAIDVLSCDTTAMYDFVHLSNKVIADISGATLVSPFTTTVELAYNLRENMTLYTSSRSGSINKLFYDKNTKMINGSITVTNGATGVSLPIIDIPALTAQTVSTNKPTSLKPQVRYDGTNFTNTAFNYDTTNNYFYATLPSGTTRFYMEFNNIYLPEGLLV